MITSSCPLTVPRKKKSQWTYYYRQSHVPGLIMIALRPNFIPQCMCSHNPHVVSIIQYSQALTYLNNMLRSSD